MSALERHQRPETEPRLPAWANARDVESDGLLDRCVEPILHALGWRGDQAQILEAMPHFKALSCISDLRLVFHHMGFQSKIETVAPEALSEDLLPAIWMNAERPMVALARRSDGGLRVFDPELQRHRIISPSGMLRLCALRAPLAAETADVKDRRWFRNALFNLSPDVGLLTGVSLFINLLVLAPPFFTMGVYNLVLPSEGLVLLGFVVAVAVLAVALELRLRRLRARMLATIAGRLSNAVGTAGVARVLSLPYAMFEKSSVSTQLNWLRQFEAVTGAFNGPVAPALCDLPFALALLIVVGLIGGPLVLPTLIAITLMISAALLLAPASERAARRATMMKATHTNLLREMLTSVDTIREAGAEPIWRSRLRAAHRESVSARVRAARLDTLRQNVNMLLIALASISTLAAGAVMVTDQRLNLGALIAVTMISARIYNPVTTLLMRLQAFRTARNAAKRFESLLSMETDRTLLDTPPVLRRFQGRVRLQELAFRYPNANSFALRGVDATIEPGQALGLVGPSGSGRSTLVKLLLGLYRPTSGSIWIDGVNLAQLHRVELRNAMAYAPSDPQFFYGTLAQNLRLAAPLATTEELEDVLQRCGVVLGAAPFKDGLDTRLSARGFDALPAMTAQRIALARALLKKAPLTILNAPTALLGDGDQELLPQLLAERKGETTFIVATNRESVLQHCDAIMALVDGKMAGVRPASTVFQTAKRA